MPEFYDLSNGHITGEVITAARARELHDRAASTPEADLDGDLETGFHYWSVNADGQRLVRHHVTPRDEPSGPHLTHGNL